MGPRCHVALGTTALVLAVGGGAARAQEPECPPAAVVSGDAQLAAEVRGTLSSRGIAGQGSTACPAVRAVIAQGGELLVVTLTDGYGRTSERQVRDLETATALIESWTRQEIDINASPPEPDRGAAPAAEPVAAVAATAPAVGAGRRAGLSLGVESARSTDGTTWLSSALSGCARLGPVCAGGLFRVAGDGWTSSTGHSRLGFDLLAIAELPVVVGDFGVAPGVAAGVAWTRTDNVGLHADEVADTGGMRLGASLSVTRRLGGGFAAELLLSADGLLFTPAASVDDPPVPRGFFRGGLGFRYGGR